jgi:NosR/NirI family nitrous oxide reductase transcriptional regulator
MKNVLRKYFNWLQKDVPRGDVEKYPELDKNGETSVKGIFVMGDLTGIPLLKLAAESGAKLVKYLTGNESFRKARETNKKDILDVLIVGAGPSGISAGLELKKLNYNFKILDSTKKFTTIINFPKGKPIYAEPVDYEQEAELKIHDGTKESLLEELYDQVKDQNLPIEEGISVSNIIKGKNYFEVETDAGKRYKALRILLGIGKSGNPRMLNVPGEELPKVFNRLFDPEDASGQKVLVVGGGDSALETAIAVAQTAESVTLSYRGDKFSRPKEGNEKKLQKLVDDGKVKLLLNSNVKEIRENSVILKDKNGNESEVENTMIFTMIGNELPTKFFKRIGIKMEGEFSLLTKLMFAELLLISCVIYFGKSSPALKSIADVFKVDSWSEVFSNILNTRFLTKFFTVPFAEFVPGLFTSSWYRNLEGIISFLALVASVVIGTYLLYYFFRNINSFITSGWTVVKYSYLIFAGIFFLIVFFGSRYFNLNLFGESPGFYYTFLYSSTILLFGLRRIKVRPTRYIKAQTTALILIQIFPLFILPEFIFPFLGKVGALGGKDGFIFIQVFPNESYWRSYGFILAWPLNIMNLYNGSITTFWFVFSMVQTFVFIPLIIRYWGKGAYCGWICSCGALAETLGDEHRTKMPHGASPKKWELAGQWVLGFAFLITAAKLIAVVGNFNIPVIHSSLGSLATEGRHIYLIVVDIIFAGVLGLGVYFFLSGRVWCRFLCPLAALMHIFSRFSRYRIFADKKKCISCNICTKVCHMGIDVMNYANKGIPMNDVECVSCSACVVNCPTEVLSFGMLPKADTENKLYKKVDGKGYPKEHWLSGL